MGCCQSREYINSQSSPMQNTKKVPFDSMIKECLQSLEHDEPSLNKTLKKSKTGKQRFPFNKENSLVIEGNKRLNTDPLAAVEDSEDRPSIKKAAKSLNSSIIDDSNKVVECKEKGDNEVRVEENEYKRTLESSGEKDTPEKNELTEVGSFKKNFDLIVQCNTINTTSTIDTVVESDNSQGYNTCPLLFSKNTLEDEERKELERKRDRIFARFKEIEEKEAEGEKFGSFRVFEKLNKNKRLQHSKSLKIQKMAQLLEDHMLCNSQCETKNKVHLVLDSSDHYIGLFLQKPVTSIKTRKKSMMAFRL